MAQKRIIRETIFFFESVELEKMIRNPKVEVLLSRR
jgi:hypothetical protein